jgi:hypothetical protein
MDIDPIRRSDQLILRAETVEISHTSTEEALALLNGTANRENRVMCETKVSG